MECICSMLATFANTVVSALANADTLTQPSDLGRYGQGNLEGAALSTGSPSSLFTNSQAVALIIILLGAIIATLTDRGSNLRSLGNSSLSKPTAPFNQNSEHDRNNNGGGGEIF